MPFDVQGSRNAGYSEDEIVAYLTETSNFDLKGAQDVGYSNDEIINHLSGYDGPQPGPVVPGESVSTTAGIPREEPGPIIPGESISVITGKPVTAQEVAPTGEGIKKVGRALREAERPVLEVGSAVAGSIAGIPSGPIGMVAGGALGYAGGKGFADILEGKKRGTLKEESLKVVQDIGTGAVMEMTGPVAGKIIAGSSKVVGKFTKEILGASTGAGPGMIDEAIKGGRAFTKAMRGKTTGSEVVDNAMDALQTIRSNRAFEYQKQLAQIKGFDQNINIKPISKKLGKLLDRFNVKVTDKGFDYSRIAMGKKGRADIEDVVELVSEWGQKDGDTTAIGLDVLKRQLDDFFSESSQARSFVQALKKTVRQTINKEVPAYAKMTKKYGEISNLIKDIESNLMMRKRGMSGRITPDQTLRRLSSSMRENFELRRELVEQLGSKSGEDIAGQVAGYSAEQLIPRGLVGKVAAGSAGVLAYVNPKFWPLLVASSPRAVGEFLKVYGKGLREIQKTSPATLRAMGYASGKILEDNREQ